jgi:hypothetical protein
MRIQAAKASAAIAIAVITICSGPSPARAMASAPPPGTTCTWGGTAAAPTGAFTITPGLTNLPLATPARFSVTGELGGDPACYGTLAFVGQIDASGTCSFNTFEGKAKGIPTVTDFAGVGAGPLGPARLYDREGHVVASENANVNTVENFPHYMDCSTPQGFRGGNFSSTIVFLDEQ